MNRDILKRKLQAVGIGGDLYQWLCDYLNDRKQFANVNSKHSSVKIIVYGVPQGSLLGPCLFSIHVNDLPDFVSQGYLFMFADDTILYCVGKDTEGIIDMMNKAAKELFNWCKKNQLTVHTGKTEAMIIPYRFYWTTVTCLVRNFHHKLCHTQHLPRNNNWQQIVEE